MSQAAKERLDNLLVAQGLCESRSQAQGLILSGKVRVNDAVVTKAGTLFEPAKARIEVEERLPYVSRGGLKLAQALREFQLAPTGRVCLDIGASSGGFTDCLLQEGAVKVYAIDVGYGQLDWRLRQDPRVVVMEKTNVRHLKPDDLAELASLAVIDVSFISLKKVLPGVVALMTTDTPVLDIIALVKPQFEYKDYLSDSGFKGVVRGEDKHQQILGGLLSDIRNLLPDWQACHLTHSPITGPKGNIEFLLHLRRASEAVVPDLGVSDEVVAGVITKSYQTLLQKES